MVGLYRREGGMHRRRSDACEGLNTCDRVKRGMELDWSRMEERGPGAKRGPQGDEGEGWANEEEGSVLALAAKEGHVGWVGVHG